MGCMRFYSAAWMAHTWLLHNCVSEIFHTKIGWVQNFSSCCREISLQVKNHLHIASCRSLGNLFMGPKLRDSIYKSTVLKVFRSRMFIRQL